MKTVGIVAEYNPFHNGHKSLIDFSAANGYSHCIAVMSGNFVQRSSPAITEKRVRTLAALHNGVDLMLELPLPYAVATAQHFSLGAVGILKATGCVDALCFGSEYGDTAKLSQIADVLESPQFSELIPAYLAQGITFALARQLVVEELLGKDFGSILKEPNNLLGIEYIRAAKELDWNVDFITTPRVGVSHHSKTPHQQFASATFLRDRAVDLKNLQPYLPASAYKVYQNAVTKGLFPSDPQRLELAILTHLRRLTIEELALLPDISEGIEHRMRDAIRASTNFSELLGKMKTKRYTLSRIRRLILSAFLGITRTDMTFPSPYLRVLGFNNKGTQLLNMMGRYSSTPFSHSLKLLAETSEKAKRFASLESLSTDLYTLTLPVTLPCGYDFTAPGVFL